MKANPTERIEQPTTPDLCSTLSFFQPIASQPKPTVELVQLPDDNLPPVEAMDYEQDCACD